MTRLQSWLDHCADLWKARPKKDMHAMAAQLDKEFGPWPKEMGSRADAVADVERIGGWKAALAHDKAAPGTPEHRANMFVRDQVRSNRLKNKRAPVVSHTDTLQGPIDQAHLAHYGRLWAAHNDRMEWSDSTEAQTGGAQRRSISVHTRMGLMKQQGMNPIASMDDLRMLHTGVAQAVHAGKLEPFAANRYHVMRAALLHNERDHSEFHPGKPFAPSWAAMDPQALHVMRVGADHLHEAGFGAHQNRLRGVLASAIESHQVHPLRTHKASVRVELSSPYPSLHPMGSTAFTNQAQKGHNDEKRLARQRGIAVRGEKAPEPEVKAPEATPEPKTEFKMPASYQEFKDRQEAGEQFPPHVLYAAEKMRRQERGKPDQKSFTANTLLKAWSVWRREAA